jgi:DNA polymerase I-like protein with 3'-5' exonuclease and polymerase domains
VQNFTKGPAVALPITKKGLMLALPSVRQCIIPEKGHHFIDSDWRQQELRILASYERGGLYSMLQRDPTVDMHEYAGEQIEAISGLRLGKTIIKNTVFGIIYGCGAAMRAAQLGLDDRDPDVLKQMHATKRAYLGALPDVEAFVKKLNYSHKHHVTPDRMLRGPTTSRFSSKHTIPLEPIYTIGGRLCFVENSTMDEGGDEVQSFAYKLLNTVIQGGAADMLLEAICVLDEFTDEPLTLTAHDQVLMSVPYRRAKTYARHVSHLMEDVVPRNLSCPSTDRGIELVKWTDRMFDVPLITDTKIKKRWQE